MSVILPIELNGRHVISMGHDMLVDKLISETERSEVTGMKHMIFREDGRMIASPGRAKEIFDGQGKLNMKTAPGSTVACAVCGVWREEGSSFFRLQSDHGSALCGPSLGGAGLDLPEHAAALGASFSGL